MTTEKTLDNMTAAEKRVAVAEDVIKHINFMQVRRGDYYCATDEVYELARTADSGEEAQNHIDVLSKDCKVCAIGACMLSYVRLFDQVKLSAFYNMDEDLMLDTMRDTFGDRMLRDIEVYFEGFAVPSKPCAADFVRMHPGSPERLTIIMQNIIDNGGEFNIPKLIEGVMANAACVV